MEFETDKVKNEKGKQTLEFSGIEIWNMIPGNIKNINNITRFKKQMKNWLINTQNSNNWIINI